MNKYSGVHVPISQASSLIVNKEVSTKFPFPYTNYWKDLDTLTNDSKYYKYTASITTYYQHLCVDIYNQLN